MTGIERGEQLADFGTAALPHNEPVRTHTQGLTDQLAKIQRSTSLKVSMAGFKRDDMRVDRVEFSGIFDQYQTFGRVAQAEHGGQERCLPGSGGTADQEAQAPLHNRAEKSLDVLIEHATFAQFSHCEGFFASNSNR